MADFRSIQTRMWREDEWFQSLKTDERLFWIYLFSNPSASICGMYRLPLRTMAFESGLTETRVSEICHKFAEDGKAFYENGTLWVKRMRENQLGGKLSPQQLTSIEKDLAKIPPSPLKNAYLTHYGYPPDRLDANQDTLSIGSAYPSDTSRYDTIRNDTIRNDTNKRAPAATNRNTDPLPPAAQVFIDAGGKFPAGKLTDGSTRKAKAIEYIAAHVQDTPASLDLWRRVVTNYARQWAATSYTVMVTEYYDKGFAPGEKRNGNSPTRSTFGLAGRPKTSADLEYERENSKPRTPEDDEPAF